MHLLSRELTLRARSENAVDRGRIALIVDRLAAHHPVGGQGPGWTVVYDDVDTATALDLCAADLAAVDPGWSELLLLAAVPSRPIRDPEYI
jgi:hypothetical protein